MSWTDRLRGYLPFVRRPKYTSEFNQFLSSYGWIFSSGNKSLGDYSLYEQAENNVYVYRSIEAISDTLLINGYTINDPTSQTINFERKRYLENLFANPEGYTSEMTYSMFHKQYIRSYELTGDAFIAVNYEEFEWDNNDYYKVINGFEFVPPELLMWYDDTEQWGYRQQPDRRYEWDEIIHIYEPSIHLKDLKYGVSKLEKIRLPLLMMWLGLNHNLDLLENDGIDPRAVLSFDKDVTDETFYNELARLSEYAEERKKGGTLAVKGASFQSTGVSNSDMDFLALMNLARDMILTAYGMQPGKAGIRETANLGSGSGESQDKDFKDMIKAKATLIEGAFNKVLGHNGFDEVFEFNEMDIEDKLKRSQIEKVKLDSGVLTINEVRSDYGLDPVEWGHTPLSMQGQSEEGMEEMLGADMMKRYNNNLYKAQIQSYYDRQYKI